MSRSYTPGLKILSRTKISKKRQLPLKGVVHLNVGDVVKPDDVVASTKLPGNVQMLNVANTCPPVSVLRMLVARWIGMGQKDWENFNR